MPRTSASPPADPEQKAFEATLADTRIELEGLAAQTLGDNEVQDALDDPGRDDAW